MDIALDTLAGSAPDNGPDVGARVKALRAQRRWTLQQAARATGLSLSAISKIERGELSPTLGSLNKIAAGFGIDVVTLLAPAAPQVQGRRSINRGRQGTLVPTATCDNHWLAADLTQKRMLPIRSRVRARRVEDYAEWPRHAGEIFVLVLSGRLVVHSEIYEPLRLGPGDSLYYDAATGHKWVSEGPEDAEVLWVFAGN